VDDGTLAAIAYHNAARALAAATAAAAT